MDNYKIDNIDIVSENDDETMKQPGGWKKEVKDWIITIVAAVIIAYVLQAFIMQFACVSGDSMKETLHDKDILYVAIAGRIDATNASEAEEKVFAIINDNKDKHIVLDADKLEYISSAGLRVILKIRKEEPKLAIINVAASVYEVFDMTGFTDMKTNKKAYRFIILKRQ